MSKSLLAQLFAAAAIAASGAHAAQEASPAGTPRVTRGAPIRTLNGFVENKGQWPEDVLFFAREGRIEATLLRDALVFRAMPEVRLPELLEAAGAPLLTPLTIENPHEPIVLWLPEASSRPTVEGIGELPTLHHFIQSTGCASDARGFESVLYRDVQPGIDVQVRIDGSVFTYDVLLDPGARLSDLSFRVDGVSSLELADGRTLVMNTSAGVVEQHIGASWEVDAATGDRVSLSSQFVLLDGSHAGFAFAAPDRDPARAMVIDPGLVYATYVGGSVQELLRQMVVGASGATYLLAQAFGAMPTTPGSYQTTFIFPADAWIGKLAPDGKTLEWGTFLGGTEGDQGYGIALGADGSVVIAGHTWGSFPTTPGALQPVFTGISTKSDLFVSRLDPTGSSLVWSTYYGGPDYEVATAVAVLPNGDVVVAADPLYGSLAATPGAFDPVFNAGDQMLVRLSADGSSLVFHTYFRTSRILEIAVDETGDIYLAGDIFAEDAPLPTTPGAYKEVIPPGPKSEAFVAKLDGSGTALRWATYLGGDEGGDAVWGIDVDAAGAVYVAGQTDSDNFPTTPGAFDSTFSEQNDGFVAKLLPGGSGLVWSTYLGSSCGTSGCGGDYLRDLEVDVAGNVHAAGQANEPSFPTTPGAFQPTYIGPFPSSDAHLTKLDAFGEKLVYSTWFGANGTDYECRVGLDAVGHPHLGLVSYSTNLPTTPGTYQPVYGGIGDMAVAVFDLPLLPWRVLGGGLRGSVDTPNLAGAGSLVPGSPTRLAVRGAIPISIAWIVVGVSKINMPLLGGTLVPSPDVYFALPTSGLGTIDFTASWPSLPAGMTLTFQAWVFDPAAPQIWSATNAVEANVQLP